MLQWEFKKPGVTINELGWVPLLVSASDQRPAKEQIDDGYAYQGGWLPFPGFQMLENGNLKLPGDPEVQLIAEAKLRGETLRFYEYDWLAIVQPDHSFEVARLIT